MCAAMTKFTRLLFSVFFLCPREILSDKGILDRLNKTENTSPSTAFKTYVTENTSSTVASTTSKPTTLKKILFWTPPKCKDCAPFPSFKSGNEVFRKLNCEYQNCYITPNHTDLSTIDPENYDALMFNGRPTQRMGLERLPRKRREEQVYIFVQMESAPRFPMCHSHFDDFFNWTVTYRLDSDIPWTYFGVRTMNNVTIGPNKLMDWAEENDLEPLSDDLLIALSKKTKLAAWFVSNCIQGNSGRMGFVKKLNEELQRINKNMSVDIYGKCGPLRCPRKESERCNKLVQDDYMFYMALENSFDEDYITEKVLKGLQYNTLPVVYSTANYSRFLPPKSYLNARKIGAKKLAQKMIEMYTDREGEYAQYFKWKSKYQFWDKLVNAQVACKICEKLNTDKGTTRHLKFRDWWNKEYANHCLKKAS